MCVVTRTSGNAFRKPATRCLKDASEINSSEAPDTPPVRTSATYRSTTAFGSTPFLSVASLSATAPGKTLDERQMRLR
jgi:hypothetical protein